MNGRSKPNNKGGGGSTRETNKDVDMIEQLKTKLGSIFNLDISIKADYSTITNNSNK